VREAVRETPDVVTLTLEPGEGARPVRCRPGQFAMLYAFGAGEVPISLSADGGPSRLVHTVREVGGVTAALCRAEPGDVLGLRGPFGNAWPLQRARGGDLVVAAGGIGLAPLRPVLRHVLRRREDWGDVVLLYGARNPDELLYMAEFEAWRAADVQVEVTVDNAGMDWTGHVGVVTTLVRHGRFESARASALLCGPEVMMRFTARELEEKGVPPERIHVSMERNMKCAVGLCGRCQLATEFICRDGPVFCWPRVRDLLDVREL